MLGASHNLWSWLRVIVTKILRNSAKVVPAHRSSLHTLCMSLCCTVTKSNSVLLSGIKFFGSKCTHFLIGTYFSPNPPPQNTILLLAKLQFLKSITADKQKQM